MNIRCLCLVAALSFSFSACTANKLPETGKQFAALAPFDKLMRNFMRENEIPGAALAVAKDGRLVYARSFGYANRERKEPVRPDSLFRIASISKPLTAVATLQLIEQGKLKLDDRVFKLLPHQSAFAERRQDRSATERHHPRPPDAASRRLGSRRID